MTLPEWLLLISALLSSAVLVSIGAARVRIPLTVILAISGLIAAWVGGWVALESPLRGRTFEEVLVFAFLPILVFEAALGLSTRAFFRNLLSILVLAIPALVVSTVLVGMAVHLGTEASLTAALLFGALISATDPVAVVGVFRRIGVPQRLLSIIEGESLLNDGVAIVLVHILLAAALGHEVSVGEGLVDFAFVFVGGIGIGTVAGFAAAFLLPWIDRLSAAALSVAVAYGGFVVADQVLGVSGVMATVAAGIVMGGLAPSRASAEIRQLWRELWEALGYIANALLFLLIGLAIDPTLLTDHLGAIGLAIAVVLVARALAVVPLVVLLERMAVIPAFGMRNQAVVVWGGLRGGVALALALALPETLPERELFIAMTGGVVVATLALNATTISALVRVLGIAEPSRAERFLAASARLTGIAAARRQLTDLGLDDARTSTELEALERRTVDEIRQITLTPAEELRVVTGRGLAVERETYQLLHDIGLLQPAVTRLLLHEVDDRIEETSLGRSMVGVLRKRDRPAFDRVVETLVRRLPPPAGDDPEDLAYAEVSARFLAARRTTQALDLFAELPNVAAQTIQRTKETFTAWEQDAADTLAELDEQVGEEGIRVRRLQAQLLSKVAAEQALRDLASVGLLPEALVDQASAQIAAELALPHRGDVTV